MKTVDMSVDEGEALLARIAEQLPPAITMGKPVLVAGSQVVTDAESVFELEGDRLVSRVKVLPGGAVEVCYWSGGCELQRYLAQVR